MTDEDYEVEICPGVVEIDANELAVRIYEAITGLARPNDQIRPELIISSMRETAPQTAAVVARIANTCVDYFGECVKGYARRV